MEIHQGEPPPKRGGTGKYEPLFQAAREVGDWVWISASGRSLTTIIQRGELRGCEPGEFEAVTRTVDGEQRLYVRPARPEED